MLKNFLKFLKFKIFYLDLKKTNNYSEFILNKAIYKAITEINKLKNENLNIHNLSHCDKTWKAVELVISNENILNLCQTIMCSKEEKLIKGFLFSRIKFLYDSKFKK